MQGLWPRLDLFRLSQVTDKPRKPVHGTINDAECFEVLLELEEVLPVVAEFAGRSGNAANNGRFWKLADVARMLSVCHERDGPHGGLSVQLNLYPTRLVDAAQHLSHPQDPKLRFRLLGGDLVRDPLA